MTLDIELIRSQTPGLMQGVHLNAAGSALMPQPVIKAIMDHTLREASVGGYEAQAQRADELDAVYDDIAALIGAERTEIAILENATAAWCQAFYALPLKAGDRILTCEAEYAANFVAFLQREKRDGIIIDVVPSDETGVLDLEALEAKIDADVALIAITWVPTNGGLVNPAAGVGEIAKRHNIPYLLDACQAVGQMPVDVKTIGCDFLSATGRKFLRGPRGTGFLYVAKPMIEILEPVMIDFFAALWVSKDRYELRDDARRFENWDNSYALRAGLGAAVAYANELGLEHIRERAWGLAASLRETLGDVAHANIHDLGPEPCAIVSFSLDGTDATETAAHLRTQGIFIDTSDPVSTRLDAEARGLPVLLRASPHYYNTEDELDRLVAALKSLT